MMNKNDKSNRNISFVYLFFDYSQIVLHLEHGQEKSFCGKTVILGCF